VGLGRGSTPSRHLKGGTHISSVDSVSASTRLRSAIILGDDLSGTTEALAAALGGHGAGWVHLHLTTLAARFAQAGSLESALGWDAVDLDVRQLPDAVARDRYTAALRRALCTGVGDVLLLKVDSLLRGNVAAALAAVRPAAHRPVVLAPALPAQGRRTVLGRVRLAEDRMPLPGALEGAREDVAAAAGRPTAVLGLDVVRADPQALTTVLGDLAEEGIVAVCDAETDADLDAVAEAAIQHRNPVVVGAGGVAAALGRALRAGAVGADDRPHAGGPCCPDPGGTGAPVLVVVGTAEPRAHEQISRLEQDGAVVQTVDPRDPVHAGETAAVLGSALRTGCAVLSVAPRPLNHEHTEAVLESLAHTAAAVVKRHPDVRLVLTGGATARAVLARLDVATLRLRCQVHPGAAHLTTEDQRDLVTRPGSHGGPDSLAQLAHHLGARLVPRTTTPAQVAAQPSMEGKR
jgi:uncharacterized protein YgbK (DUF1537 family)